MSFCSFSFLILYFLSVGLAVNLRARLVDCGLYWGGYGFDEACGGHDQEYAHSLTALEQAQVKGLSGFVFYAENIENGLDVTNGASDI